MATPFTSRLLAECVGTFFLVLCGTGAIVIDAASHGAIGHAGIALTFGLAVLALIYALGDISGAHFNPAVSLAFAVSRRFPVSELPWYAMAQIAGALAASACLAWLYPQDVMLGATLPSVSADRAFVLEGLMSLLLMLVILGISSGAKEKGIVAGMVVGAVVGLEAMFAGPATGASMNPARSLAPALLSGQFRDLWIYLIAPSLGMLLAIPLHRVLLKRSQ